MRRLLKIVVLGAATAALIVSGVLVAGAATTAGETPLAPAKGIWLSQAEILALPTSGAAWDRVKSAADGPLGAANIANQDSDHDVLTLAAALAYARTGTDSYRVKAADALADAIGTEAGGRTLALARNLPSYVIAADLINLPGYDAQAAERFRAWLAGVRHEKMSDGRSLVEMREQRANNWGTNGGAALAAADTYLGDTVALAREAVVFRGWLGDRVAYAGFSYGSLAWQAAPQNPVGVNPTGATIQGHNVDGVLPDDQRRGGGFTWPPPCENYVWGGWGPALVEAELLRRAGYPALEWSDRSLLRAGMWLRDVAGCQAQGDDKWVPWLANYAYGAGFPADPAGAGKTMGWTDWTHGGRTTGTVPPPPATTTEPPPATTTEPPPATTTEPPPPPPPTCDQACVDAYEQAIAQLTADRDAARADAASLQSQLDAWVAWYSSAP